MWQLNVDGCIRIGRGGREGGGGESMRDLGKRRTGRVGDNRFKLVLFEIIKLIYC